MPAWSCRNWDTEAALDAAQRDADARHSVCYATAFLPGDGSGGHLLATGHSTGEVRIYDWRGASQQWLSARRAAHHALQWRAHKGGVYALSIAGGGEGGGAVPVLVTCGDDGRVRGWSIAEIFAAAAEQQQRQHEQQQQQQQQQQDGDHNHNQQQQQPHASGDPTSWDIEPLFDVLLPRADPPLPVAATAPPAAQALACDATRGRLFIGASDGGLHVADLERLASPRPSSSSSSGVVQTFSAHAAAVLGLDACSASGAAATASEDATVRVWDARADAPCVAAIDPSRGAALPPADRAAALQCLRAPPATCVRFAGGGEWLVIGGGAGLTLWSLGLGAAAKRLDAVEATPQALYVLPGEVLVAGAGPGLSRYRFALDAAPPARADTGLSSVFALDVEPGSGAAAAGGAGGGGLALLSPHGTRLGRAA